MKRDGNPNPKLGPRPMNKEHQSCPCPERAHNRKCKNGKNAMAGRWQVQHQHEEDVPPPGVNATASLRCSSWGVGGRVWNEGGSKVGKNYNQVPGKH